LTIRWGKSQGKQDSSAEGGSSVPGLPMALPPPPEELKNNFFNFPTEAKGFDNAPGPSGVKTGISAPPQGSVPFYFPRAGAPPPPPGPPGSAAATGPRPPALPGPGRIHYPSQDPSRMGATQNQ